MTGVIPRFHAASLDRDSLEVDLPPDEAHHLAHVLRLSVGAAVRVFDGRGLEREARVLALSRRGARLALGAAVQSAREMAVRVTLVQAVLKHEAMDTVVRDATMLGVAAIVPLLAARCTVPTRAIASGRAVERWHRIAVGSAKQSGRAVVPEVRAPATFDEWLAADEAAVRLLLVEPERALHAAGGRWIAARRDTAVAGGVSVAVGPEGGWAADEVDAAARRGVVGWSLGQRTLRAEVAPVVALAILCHEWDDDGGVRS